MIYVEQGGSIQVSADDEDELSTGALGPCLGFILYKSKSKRAIGGHCDSFIHHEDDIRRTLGEALAAFEFGEVHVYVGGCGPNMLEGANESADENMRDLAKDLFDSLEASFHELSYLWTEPPSGSVELSVDLETGQFFTHTHA